MNCLAIWFLFTAWQSVSAIIGYDCGSKILNMTTISLLDIDECDVDENRVDVSLVDVFLLQMNEYEHVNIMQCKVEIHRTIHYCGASSHIAIVENAYMEYIHPISREMCQVAHNHGTLRLGQTIIDGLMVNSTTTRSITLAGAATVGGSCEQAYYSYPYGSWSQVVVLGTVRISLRSTSDRVKVKNNKVYLPSGYHCVLKTGTCIDSEGGHTSWDPLPGRYCADNTYSILYQGHANKLKSKTEVVYTVNVRDTSFSLRTTGAETSCDLTIHKTERPKLFIVEGKDLGVLEKNNAIQTNADNLDIFLYVNAKMIYVERYIRYQVQSLYLDVMKHRCRLETELLKNTLAIASTQPDELPSDKWEDLGTWRFWQEK